MLDKIDSPEALRLLSKEQLPEACDALRTCLLETVADTGGHFAAVRKKF